MNNPIISCYQLYRTFLYNTLESYFYHDRTASRNGEEYMILDTFVTLLGNFVPFIDLFSRKAEYRLFFCSEKNVIWDLYGIAYTKSFTRRGQGSRRTIAKQTQWNADDGLTKNDTLAPNFDIC